MMCYYSSVKVVRLPTDMQPNLVLEQAQKLYGEIERGCQNARERKSKLRMLLDAEQLQSYLEDAFDLYSQSLDIPFDFVQASFLHNPIPFDFGGNILKLAIAMTKAEKIPDAHAIFSKLGNIVASCIMLDAVRHKVPGTASLIFPQYLEYLDEALQGFCDRHWPCEYIMRGITPADLQYDLNHTQCWQSSYSPSITYRCINVQSGHGSKGHQNKDGRIFARGDYFARFSFQNNHEKFQAGVYFRLEHLLNQLAECTRRGDPQEVAAAKMHRSNLLDFFHQPASEGTTVSLQNRTVCWCCLFEGPEHTLSCGHVLCTPCVKAYGRPESRTIVQIHECPFESYGRSQPRSIYIKPEAAGLRMLVLDDGGARGIIQLEILHLIEKELSGKIPLQLLFDLIVGSGSGSIIGLGLLTGNWTANDCKANFLQIFKDSFAARNRRTFSRLKHSTCKYHPKPLEQSLRVAFTENQPLLGAGTDGRVGAFTKLAIPVVSSTSKMILFANYVRQSSIKLPYEIYCPGDTKEEIDTWEAARAAMAQPFLFKPFKHKSSNQVYSDRAYGANLANPIEIAAFELKAIWGSSPTTIVDIVVSLGSGFSLNQPGVPTSSEKGTRFEDSAGNFATNKRQKRGLFDQQCENTWKDYLRALPSSSAPTDSYIRLNIKAVELPAIDDISSADDLRNMVQTQINAETIRILTSRLIAKLFYFEKLVEMEMTSGGDLFLRGEILCRIPDGTPEIAEIGKVFLSGKFQSSEFVVQEHLCGQQRISIHPSVIEAMIHSLQFRMPEIMINISERFAEFNITLHLKNREEYSISGFPRFFAGERVVEIEKHTRNSSGSAPSIRRRSQWTPPNSARYFDSGLQVSDKSNSIPSPPSSTTNSTPNNVQVSTRRAARQPLELDAHDTRDLQAIQEAMKIQRERDRIRSEEVAPLQKQVKNLEANQLELTTLLAQLQKPSSEIPPQSRETDFHDLYDA
ncbi:FabD/lysophospholipase-like protein [Stipitochalara longipes BDJ]|nr:FabD/lysophospholipase-like protein [Stipitochalara longipes BDJ]